MYLIGCYHRSMRRILLILFALPLASISVFRTNLRIYSSTDWTIITFKSARIALCSGNQIGKRFRCYPDRIVLIQDKGKICQGTFTLYFFQIPYRDTINIKKGSIGKVRLEFNWNEKKKTLTNFLSGSDVNSKNFTVSLPGEMEEFQKDLSFERLVLSFYYTWYGNPEGPSGKWIHWNSCGHNPDIGDINAAHFPLLGPYDSSSPEVIKTHIKWAKSSGIDAFIIPWFGENNSIKGINSFVNEAIKEKFNFAVSFPFPDYPIEVSPEYAATQIIYILKTFSLLPNYLKIKNRPVFFFFSADQFNQSFWRKTFRIVKANGFNPFYFAHTKDSTTSREFDGIYFYLPIFFQRADRKTQTMYFRWANVLSNIKNCPVLLPVFPGFDNRKGCNANTLFVPRNNGNTLLQLFSFALAQDPEGIIASTFNEWHEGTEFEPSREYGFFYLTLLSILTNRFKNHEKIRC